MAPSAVTNPFGEEVEQNPFQLDDEPNSSAHAVAWSTYQAGAASSRENLAQPQGSARQAPAYGRPPAPSQQQQQQQWGTSNAAAASLRAASSAAREAELERRELELKAREARLSEREKEVGDYHPPNFPPFKPMVYHDIANDIPEGGRWIVKRLFTAWWLAVGTYLVNFAAAFSLLVTKAESGGATFGLALVILLVGTPVSYGVKRNRSISFFLFFVNFGFHLAFSALLAIGIPGWGGAGVIYTLQQLGSNIGVGVLCAVSSGLLIFEVVFGLWQIKAVSGYYRSKGLTAQQAKEQAIQGVASSSIGREMAGAAIKSSLAGSTV
ncbi:hypothetical protein HK405_006085 [Cladochytrium tenue]|nr:hypothetical protein HK405_006085 [Cladochytrium tenue]